MELSLVLPILNEEENLPLLMEALTAALNPLGRSWEVLFVDDGSNDKTIDILRSFAQDDPEHVRAISFRRNFGQTAALAAGIDHAQGDIIILLDADMQNDPADIP